MTSVSSSLGKGEKGLLGLELVKGYIAFLWKGSSLSSLLGTPSPIVLPLPTVVLPSGG